MNTSAYQPPGQLAQTSEAPARPQWFDSNAPQLRDEEPDIDAQKQDEQDAPAQSPNDYHQLIMENYLDDGKKPRDNSKEMLSLLEKKYLNTNIEEYLDEYLRTPAHQLLSYKYPKNLASRYMDVHQGFTAPSVNKVAETATQSPNIREVSRTNLTFDHMQGRSMSQQSFNYDKIRSDIRDEYLQE